MMRTTAGCWLLLETLQGVCTYSTRYVLVTETGTRSDVSEAPVRASKPRPGRREEQEQQVRLTTLTKPTRTVIRFIFERKSTFVEIKHGTAHTRYLTKRASLTAEREQVRRAAPRAPGGGQAEDLAVQRGGVGGARHVGRPRGARPLHTGPMGPLGPCRAHRLALVASRWVMRTEIGRGGASGPGGPGWGSLLWRCRMTQRTRRGGSWWHLAPQGSPLDHWGGCCAFRGPAIAHTGAQTARVTSVFHRGATRVLRPRAHPGGAFDWQWPIRRSRAPPRRPERPTPPDMTPGDSQGRPRAAGPRGLVT